MPRPVTRFTVAEYLALEAASETKHEYDNGEIIAMAGASPRHNLISMNVASALRQLLAESPCRVFGSDQRVRVDATDAYAYPDVSVVCSEPRIGDDRPASLLNPILLVEILSPSTADYDRGAKLAHYRRLASVREILLVESDARRVELYRRLDDGTWKIKDFVDGTIALESAGVALALDEIYAKTEGLPQG